MNKRDYRGKAIFVGIDVHKKTYSVAVVYDKELVKRDTLPAYPERLITYLNKFFPGAVIKSAYEAGFSGYMLHRALLSAGVENIVVHAASIEIGARDRVKTDKRDAKKIATQLESERLRGIHVPSLEMEDRQELTRTRDWLVKRRSQVAARLKLKAMKYGLIEASDRIKVSKRWIKEIAEKPMMEGLRFTMTQTITLWEEFSQKIRAIEKELDKQAHEDEALECVYRSFPGVGPIASRVLANELGNMEQFSSAKKLASYTGLTPSEFSSGEHIRRGHISRQGKAQIRQILIQCSWIAIKYDKNLYAIYESIGKRAGSKRAIVAVARHLIIRIRACFRKGEFNQSTQAAKAA